MDRSSGSGGKTTLLQAGLLAISITLLFWISAPKTGSRLASQDNRVLLSDFVDAAGENSFALGLKQVLILALNQSPHLGLVPESRVLRIMKGLHLDPVRGLTPEAALAVCARDRVPYLLIPSLTRLGDSYLLGVRLVRVGEAGLRESTVETLRTNDKIDLILEMNHTAVAVRRAMGESDRSLAATGPLFDRSAAANAEALTLFAQALALEARKNYEDELGILHYCVQLNPRLSLALLKLGELRYRLGWSAAAAATMGQAVQLSETLPLKERGRASALLLLMGQDYQRARDEFRVLANQFPSDPELQLQLAEASLLAYDFSGAKTSFEAAVRLEDSNIEAYLGLSLACLYEGSVDTARKVWQRANDLQPDHSGVLATGGLIDLFNNDLGSAMAAFRKMTESPSETARSRGTFLEAQGRIYGGKFESALAGLADGIEIDQRKVDPDSVGSKRLTRAAVYLLLGDDKRALEECIRMPVTSTRAEEIALMGTIFARAGRIDDAGNQLRRIESLPNSSWTRFHAAVLRGEIELASGRPQAAIPLLEQAKTIFPGCRALEPLARALVQARLNERAEKEYGAICQEKALTLFPPAGGWFMGTWPDALFETARLLDSVGKKADALQFYRNYLWVLDGADGGLPKVQQAKEALKRSSAKKKP